MGVEGAVGFVEKQGHKFSSRSTLKSTHLIIDATHGLGKLVERNIKSRVPRFDAFGYSMVALAAFQRDLIKSLINNNIQPLFVFNGGRKSEDQFGPNVSCAEHFRYSCGAALRYIGQVRPGRSFDLPELATNVLKEVICEMNLEQNMFQATYEVYPTLLHLARQFNCPVMTGHSDFVFHPAPAGFYWFDHVDLPQDTRQPITGTLYEHSRLLQAYNLNEQHSSTLSAFSTLLRPDFHRNYYEPLNNLFRLNGEMRMSAYVRDRKLTRRLTHIMNTVRDNTDLSSYETVRNFLSRLPTASGHLMRDFENTHETYATHFNDFATTEFGQLLNRGPRRPMSARSPVSPGANIQAGRVQPADFVRALTRRQSTAEFYFNLGNTSFFRTRVEDITLARSTFSCQDTVRQYLLDNAMAPVFTELRLYDRRLSSMQERRLRRRAGANERPSRESILGLFHIDNETLARVTGLCTAKDIDEENASELALFLLLARFGMRVFHRRDYNNDPQPTDRLPTRSPKSNSSASLGSKSNEILSMRRLRDYNELKPDFYTALVNSFVYHARENQGDQSSQSIPADIRVAREKLRNDIVSTKDPSILPENNYQQYIRLKHMIEVLNSVPHAYVEINSFYGYLAPRLHIAKHYDGVLMYKIMSRLSNKLRGYLLNLGPELSDILDLAPSPEDEQA